MSNEPLVCRGISFVAKEDPFHSEKERYFIDSLYGQLVKDRETPSANMTRCKFRNGSLSEVALAYAKDSGKYYFRNELEGYFESDSVDGDNARFIGAGKDELNLYLEKCYEMLVLSARRQLADKNK